MRRDHKVRFRSEESLMNFALQCRQFAGNENFARFNVINFVQLIVPKILMSTKSTKKGALEIKFLDADSDGLPAYVTYNPLTLHVHQEVWDLANLGDPDSRFIIAHEVGHLLLHDHYAQAFSTDPSQQIKFAQKEERAEWQANTFASYLLITPRIVDAFTDAKELARSCEVPQDLANERAAAAIEDKRRSARRERAKGYTGETCTNCGNFTLVANGLSTICDTCGNSENVLAAK